MIRRTHRHFVALAAGLSLLVLGVAPGSAESKSKKRTVELSDGAVLVIAPGVKATLMRRGRVRDMPAGERRLGGGVRLRLSGRRARLATLRFRLPENARALEVSDAARVYGISMWQRKSWHTLPIKVSADRRHVSAILRGRRAKSARASQIPLLFSGGAATFIS